MSRGPRIAPPEPVPALTAAGPQIGANPLGELAVQ